MRILIVLLLLLLSEAFAQQLTVSLTTVGSSSTSSIVYESSAPEATEGEIVSFTATAESIAPDESTMPKPLPELNVVAVRIYDMPGGDFVPPRVESSPPQFNIFTSPTSQTEASSAFAFDTNDNDFIDTATGIRAEIIPSPGVYTIVNQRATTRQVRNNNPVASIDAPAKSYKGTSIMFRARLASPVDRNTPLTLIVAETTADTSFDFIDDMTKTVVIPAGSTQVTQRIPIRAIGLGNNAAIGSVNLSIGAPQGGAMYTLGSSASAVVSIVDLDCDYAFDVDGDDDGLIEVCYLDDLDQIRYSLDGSGHRASRSAPLSTTGCDDDGDDGGVCRGYELVNSLDFNNPNSYRSGSINRAWTEGLGWLPLGISPSVFSGYFEANGNSISNLYINRPVDRVALFANASASATINSMELLQVSVRGKSRVGSLVAVNEGIVSNNVISSGSVAGSVGMVWWFGLPSTAALWSTTRCCLQNGFPPAPSKGVVKTIARLTDCDEAEQVSHSH